MSSRSRASLWHAVLAAVAMLTLGLGAAQAVPITTREGVLPPARS